MLGHRDAGEGGTFGGTVTLSPTVPHLRPGSSLVLLPEVGQDMTGLHPRPSPEDSPPPGSYLSPSLLGSTSGVAHLCAEFSTFSACTLPAWLSPRRISTASPQWHPGDHGSFGVTSRGAPVDTPASARGRADQWLLPHPPKFHCFDVFLKKRPRFGHRRAKPQDTDGTGGVGSPVRRPPLPRDPPKPDTATAELHLLYSCSD